MLNIIFICSTLLALILFYLGTGKNKRVLLFSAVWLLISGVLAYSGFFENTKAMPPRFALVLIVINIMAFYFYKITVKKDLSANLLLAIHALRLPVEIGLHQLFLLKLIPVYMTFHGWNFDIVMGISGLLLALYVYFSKKELPKTLFLIWNFAGLIFLGVIVVIAILSSPLPFQQLAFDQPNIAVLKFPFVFLPGYIVPIVLVSHILLIKKLRKN